MDISNSEIILFCFVLFCFPSDSLNDHIYPARS